MKRALLGLFAKKNNIKIKYDKNIIVRHFEDGSMSISNINEYNFRTRLFIIIKGIENYENRNCNCML